MSIILSIYNESDMPRIPRQKINNAVLKACKGENISDIEVRIIIVSNKRIHELNRNYLNHDYPTDVLTFTLNENPIEGEIYIGDKVAAEQAREYRVSISNELMRLSVHGVLHLVGYNDDTAEKRSIMSEIETRYIAI